MYKGNHFTNTFKPMSMLWLKCFFCWDVVTNYSFFLVIWHALHANLLGIK